MEPKIEPKWIEELEMVLRRHTFNRDEFPVPLGIPAQIVVQIMAIIRERVPSSPVAPLDLMTQAVTKLLLHDGGAGSHDYDSRIYLQTRQHLRAMVMVGVDAPAAPTPPTEKRIVNGNLTHVWRDEATGLYCAEFLRMLESGKTAEIAIERLQSCVLNQAKMFAGQIKIPASDLNRVFSHKCDQKDCPVCHPTTPCTSASPCGEMVAKGVCSSGEYHIWNHSQVKNCRNWHATIRFCLGCGREEKI